MPKCYGKVSTILTGHMMSPPSERRVGGGTRLPGQASTDPRDYCTSQTLLLNIVTLRNPKVDGTDPVQYVLNPARMTEGLMGQP